MVWEGVCSGAEGARTDLIGRILTAENRKWKREPDLRSNIFQRKRDQLSVVSVKLGLYEMLWSLLLKRTDTLNIIDILV